MKASQPLRILNVNDQVAARDLVSQLLRRIGYEVLESESGTEALERAVEQPDAIVLDVRLPDLSGYEVTRQLKASPLTPGIPVVLTSAAFTASEHRVEGLDSGADAFLVQPFEGTELAATLRAVLRIRSAERSATEALQVRDDFLSIASHELKTPLTSLMLQTQQLERLLDHDRDGRPAPPRERLVDKARLIHRQARFVTSMINDLLDVSRLRAGRLSLNPERVDLTEVVRSAVERLDIGPVHPPINLQAPEPVIGFWDPQRMEQVVSNLLTNACKYGGGSPIELSVTAARDGLALLTVRDHGPGIAEEDQRRIFERFERVDGGVRQAGLGLGLWIAHEVVKSSGGTISVDSAPGLGATFKVRLRRMTS